MRPILITIACLAAVSANAATVTIDFDDGIEGNSIGSHYSSLGVTFLNAEWDDFVSPNEGGVGAGGLKLVGNREGGESPYSPSADNPIVLIFDAAVTDFSIYGLNIGYNGARIDFYDATTGGNLVSFVEQFGATTPSGGYNHRLISYSGAPVLRAELYRPLDVTTDGMTWDNITFTAVPVPAAVWLFGSGLAGLGWLRRKQAA